MSVAKSACHGVPNRNRCAEKHKSDHQADAASPTQLAKPPSQYIKENFLVTTSGMCSAEPLNCTLAALGPSRVMFAADYPFERAEEAGHFIDTVKLDEKLRDDICFNNAVKHLKLPA